MQSYKILIINQQSMFSSNQTAITLQNLFLKWPKDKLMELHINKSGPVNQQYSGMVSHMVSEKTFPMRKVAYRDSFRQMNSNMKSAPASNGEAGKKKKVIRDIRQWLYTAVDRSPMFVQKADCDAVHAFQPDVIYTMGGNMMSMKLALYFANFTDKPIIIHFMDNWQESLQWHSNRLLKHYHKCLQKMLQKIYQHCMCALTISPLMAERYNKKTAVPHYPLLNSVEVDSYFCGACADKSIEKLVYAGGLHLGRIEVLKEIGRALLQINQQLGTNMELLLYTWDKPSVFDNLPVRFMEPVEHSRIMEVYRQADVLVHVENIDYNEEINAFTKYSLSTKIPEYLSTGKAVFYAGAKELGVTQYLLHSKTAAVATAQDEIVNVLQKLITDVQYRTELVENALVLARENHDINTTTNRLCEIIQDRQRL